MIFCYLFQIIFSLKRYFMKNLKVNVSDNGNPPETWVVQIHYEFRNGYHVFTSQDISGLLIASKDAKKAFNQILPSVESLIKHNYDRTCDATFGLELKTFAKKQLNSIKEPIPSLRDTVVVIREKDAA